jgi:hypothetical protein
MKGRNTVGIKALLAVAISTGLAASASDTFLKPTPEELSMTSVPGYPGAVAVVLFREEVTNDDLHVIQHYERIKILTEEGKRYANVELNYVRTEGTDSFYNNGNEETVGEIVGRTIHSDGTIIPYTGKPYEKTIEKGKDFKYQARVFTLPSVEVGSIIEYRYSTRYNDNTYQSPDWYIQGDLFVKSAHYRWYPTSRDLIDYKQRPINSISWFPLLPEGAKIVRTETPGGGLMGPRQTYDLNVTDIPPIVREEHMPPLKSYSYRVLFSFTAYRSADEYWKSEGKEWSKHRDAFMKESKEISEATQTAIVGATTADEKLKNIYAKVMTLENTSFTRQREKSEDGKVISNVTDVLSRGRGSSSQLTELFVSMARAAGFKSYVMLVPNNNIEFFTPSWLSFNQFDDDIAIVNVDGKDRFFDPGSRYCPYGHLSWEHSFGSGIRQVEGGSAFEKTPGDGYTANKTTRVANLEMDEHGEINGKIDLAFTGARALHWRQVALRGDDESLKDSLRKMLEETVPRSLEVKVEEIKNVQAYEQPLQITYSVKGTLGAPTGRRLVMPMDLFESNSAATFADAKRETPVDFHYPEMIQDALRVNFHKGFEVEATPKEDKYDIPKRAVYSVKVETTPTSYTTRRNYMMGDYIFLAPEYPMLRTFYTQMETKDKESVVLKAVPVTTASSGGQ